MNTLQEQQKNILQEQQSYITINISSANMMSMVQMGIESKIKLHKFILFFSFVEIGVVSEFTLNRLEKNCSLGKGFALKIFSFLYKRGYFVGKTLYIIDDNLVSLVMGNKNTNNESSETTPDDTDGTDDNNKGYVINTDVIDTIDVDVIENNTENNNHVSDNILNLGKGIFANIPKFSPFDISKIQIQNIKINDVDTTVKEAIKWGVEFLKKIEINDTTNIIETYIIETPDTSTDIGMISTDRNIIKTIDTDKKSELTASIITNSPVVEVSKLWTLSPQRLEAFSIEEYTDTDIIDTETNTETDIKDTPDTDFFREGEEEFEEEFEKSEVIVNEVFDEKDVTNEENNTSLENKPEVIKKEEVNHIRNLESRKFEKDLTEEEQSEQIVCKPKRRKRRSPKIGINSNSKDLKAGILIPRIKQ